VREREKENSTRIQRNTATQVGVSIERRCQRRWSKKGRRTSANSLTLRQKSSAGWYEFEDARGPPPNLEVGDAPEKELEKIDMRTRCRAVDSSREKLKRESSRQQNPGGETNGSVGVGGRIWGSDGSTSRKGPRRRN